MEAERGCEKVQGNSKREMAPVIVTYEAGRYLSAMVIAMLAPGKIAATIEATRR